MSEESKRASLVEESLLLKIAQACQRTVEKTGSWPIKFVISQDLLRALAEEAREILEAADNDGYEVDRGEPYRICGVQIEVDRTGPGIRFNVAVPKPVDNAPQVPGPGDPPDPATAWRATCEPKLTFNVPDYESHQERSEDAPG